MITTLGKEGAPSYSTVKKWYRKYKDEGCCPKEPIAVELPMETTPIDQSPPDNRTQSTDHSASDSQSQPTNDGNVSDPPPKSTDEEQQCLEGTVLPDPPIEGYVLAERFPKPPSSPTAFSKVHHFDTEPPCNQMKLFHLSI